MYDNSYGGGGYDYYRPNISRAIAHQDEALEELIRTTHQVIKRHTNYLAENDHLHNLIRSNIIKGNQVIVVVEKIMLFS